MPNWNQVLQEIDAYVKANANDPQRARQAVDLVRRNYLSQLHAHTGRNLIAYYSGFLSKNDIGGLEINDEDKNGFMMAVHQMDRTKGLDLILHTPGGDIAATQSIVDYLHKMFGNNIRAIVPQIAMSAGTMIACSCRSVLMGSHSNLGPIDPHLRGVPCYGVIQEFRRAYREIKKDPSKSLIWQNVIGQYRPTFLSQCENSISWSNAFVRDQLTSIMFVNDENRIDKARRVVRELTNYRGNKTHNRHIHAEECKSMGLVVENLEARGAKATKLQDLVLTVHHCYMLALMNTGAYKMIENQMGAAFVKQIQVSPQFVLQQQPPAS